MVWLLWLSLFKWSAPPQTDRSAWPVGVYSPTTSPHRERTSNEIENNKCNLACSKINGYKASFWSSWGQLGILHIDRSVCEVITQAQRDKLSLCSTAWSKSNVVSCAHVRFIPGVSLVKNTYSTSTVTSNVVTVIYVMYMDNSGDNRVK